MYDYTQLWTLLEENLVFKQIEAFYWDKALLNSMERLISILNRKDSSKE